MAATEETHWWFVGRRRMITSLLEELNLPSRARLIELGAGTGGNLEMLKAFGSVSAMEYDAHAREIAAAKGGIAVAAGRLPDDIPFDDGSAEVVGLFDVLEHVEDDIGSLRAIRKLLAPGGALVLSVPAHQWLWSGHDEVLHHFRRYSKDQISRLAMECGYSVRRLTYFNSTLFPAAALVRLLNRIQSDGDVAGGSIPPRPLNSALAAILTAEARLARRLGGLPMGLSLFAVLTRDGA
jgi:SAM-dependent methyltransferase